MGDGRLPFYTFATLLDPAVSHGVSMRAGGVSTGPYASLNLGSSVGDVPESVAENRSRLACALGFAPERLITTPQVHGDGVFMVYSRTANAASTTRADILLTTTPGYLLMQRFADCVPLVFWHAQRQAVAVAHAGWRGTAIGVARRAVTALRDHACAEPAGIRVGIGPSIGPCCFEVGQEVAAQFSNSPGAVQDGPRGRPHVDLWELNRRALTEAGVPSGHIEVAGLCTRCHSKTFFSHRALGYPAGRFGAAIGLRSNA